MSSKYTENKRSESQNLGLSDVLIRSRRHLKCTTIQSSFVGRQKKPLTISIQAPYEIVPRTTSPAEHHRNQNNL